MTAEQPTKALAELVAGTEFSDLPGEVVHEAKRLILDVIGCAFGGYATDIGQAAVGVARYLGGNPQSVVIGSGDRVSSVGAAHANARMANALDADDTFLSVSHHGAPTVCSALALGEAEGVSGKELITAVAVGFEVGARLGISTGPPGFARRVKDTGVGRVGGMPSETFAAAATAANILKLDAHQTADAFGIAGVEANIGWMANKRQTNMYLHKRGYAAGTGVTVAFMAKHGMTADQEVLDGESGLWRLTGATSCNFELMVSQLGRKWYLPDTTYKPWPCNRFIHYGLTALENIMREHSLAADGIERVVLRSHVAASQTRSHSQNPCGIVNCQFSFPHGAAMLIMGITPGPDWYKPEVASNPAVQQLRQKVVLELDQPSMALVVDSTVDGQIRKVPASVEVTCGGKAYTALTEYAKGDPWTKATYFTDEELKEKFRNMARSLAVASEGWQREIEEIIDTVFRLEEIDNVNTLSHLLAVP